MKRKTLKTLGAAALFGLCSSFAQAQAQFPERPVKLVVPFPPGGTTDVVARIIAPRVAAILGQTVVIENKGGAGGSIATDMVAKSPADGYTMVMATNSHTANPFIYKRLPFDTVKDFASVALIGDSPGLFAVHPSVPANNLKEFVALAKRANPPLNFGTAGAGTYPHLAAELFKLQAGIDIKHIPYKGAGPALTDLIGGVYQFKVEGAATGYEYVKAGRLKAFGVTSKERMPQMPEIPTVAEQGYPEYETNFWMAILVPSATPKPVISKLENAFITALRDPAIASQLQSRTVRPIAQGAQAVDELIARELRTWPAVIKAAGLTPE